MSNGGVTAVGMVALVVGFMIALMLSVTDDERRAQRGWMQVGGKIYAITPGKVEKATP